jgi:two-component system phosphate regulon response regulator PhoB
MRIIPSVLVVEDESAIAELIIVNMKHNGFRAIWAMDSQGAQREIDAAVPDLILLDWMLPGESGLVLAKRWRSDPRTKSVPLIMLTARGDEADRVAGLDAGADDYIAKPFSTKELLARVRAVLRRRAPEPIGKAISIGGLSLDPETYRVTFNEQSLKLGPTEFKLLHYFMGHSERVHSRGQLLDQVWGDHVYIEERTVDVHVKRLRESIGRAGVMLETVRGAGYRFTANPHVAVSLSD